MFVTADRYWGSRTERLRRDIRVQTGFVPVAVYEALGRLKRAAAEVNAEDGGLASWKAQAVACAADDLIAGSLNAHFPLTIHHSVSGCALDMNVNEVLANRAIQLLGGRLGTGTPVHPTLDVGLKQSATAVFAAAAQIAAVLELEERLVPRAKRLARRLASRSVTPRGSGQVEPFLPKITERLWASMAEIDESEGGLHELPRLDDLRQGSEDSESPFSHGVVARVAQATRKPFALGKASAGLTTLTEQIAAMMSVLRGLADGLILLCDDHERATLIEDAGSDPRSKRRSVTSLDRIAPKDAIRSVQFSFVSIETALSAGHGACWKMQAPTITSFLQGVEILCEVCDRL